MADSLVDGLILNGNARGIRSVVFINDLEGYVFFIDSTADISYHKTTNGGKTWGSAVALESGTVDAFDVWYDQWTPGDTGSRIHIWYIDSGVDDVLYNSLNTRDDTFSGKVTVFAGATAVLARGEFVSGAKMRGGNLLCIFDIDAFAETGTYKSTNNGVTWSAMTNGLEATIDQAFVYPANLADPNDAWLLYQDASTDEITLKTYDDSANLFTESALICPMIENVTDLTGQYGFSGSIRFSDGHLIAAIWTEYDSVTGDFRVFDITNESTFTELTALATNIDDSYYPSVFIDQKTNNLYVAYAGKLDGSETIGTTNAIYYAKSTDNGLTWTTNIQISTTVASSLASTKTPPCIGVFMAVWTLGGSLEIDNNPEANIPLGNVVTNNYQFVKATGQNNTGIISVTEKIK